MGQEKCQKALQQEPFKDKGVQYIFSCKQFRDKLVQMAELHTEDLDEVYQRLRTQISQKEFADDLLEHSKTLSDPELLAEAYFFGKETPYLRKQMIQNGGDEDPSVLKSLHQKEDLPIKLFLASAHDRQYDKLDIFADLKRKVLGYFGEYGVNHAGIRVGPYLIEWNDSSLIVPRYLHGKHSKGQILINKSGSINKDKDVLQICKIICQWNNSNEIEQKRNGIQLVNEIFDTLNVKPDWIPNGPIVNFLKRMTEGKETILVCLDGSEVKIESHQDLVKFSIEYVIHNETMKKSVAVSSEYIALVKCIDRNFKLRQEANPVSTVIFDRVFGERYGSIMD